jgi:hypothetical protein
MKFDKDIAEKHLKRLLKQYKIEVVKWSRTSCGRAYWNDKQVKIPHPTDLDRFCVGIHEIKHVIDGYFGKLYQREYACEKFAIQQAELLGFDDIETYQERARRYIIMTIAKGHCRGLNLDNIEPEIKRFCNIDFSEWKGKKVFVSGWGDATYKGVPLNIEII